MEKLDSVIFFTLEKVTKSYRQFAQRNSLKNGVTIDQWLVLKTIQENPHITQQQVAKQVFKDVASVTRIIDLLVSKELLIRREHPEDRRRFELSISEKGLHILELSRPLSVSNRKKALEGISESELQSLEQILQKILSNIS